MIYKLLENIFENNRRRKKVLYGTILVGAVIGLIGGCKAYAQNQLPLFIVALCPIFGAGLGLICYFILLCIDALDALWDRYNSPFAHFVQLILNVILGIAFLIGLCAAIMLLLYFVK